MLRKEPGEEFLTAGRGLCKQLRECCVKELRGCVKKGEAHTGVKDGPLSVYNRTHQLQSCARHRERE